jgi:hypothetical protein
MGIVWTLVFVALAAIPIILWNFVPAVRERVKGWSTILEAGIGGLIYALSQATDVLKELQAAGYLPSWLVAYVPYVFIAWVVVKRFQSTTPVPIVARKK